MRTSLDDIKFEDFGQDTAFTSSDESEMMESNMEDLDSDMSDEKLAYLIKTYYEEQEYDALNTKNI